MKDGEYTGCIRITVGMLCTIVVADVTVGVEMVYAKLAGPADVWRSIWGIV
jgi:hypothetical protein